MAVTVQWQAPPLVILDDQDRIVGVGPAVECQFGPLVGAIMWDEFPAAEPLFKPYYDTARQSGEPVEFVQFYDGHVVSMNVVPVEGARLELRWELLVHLDATTFDSFHGTLRTALELLDEHGSDVQRNEARQALRVIEGGG